MSLEAEKTAEPRILNPSVKIPDSSADHESTLFLPENPESRILNPDPRRFMKIIICGAGQVGTYAAEEMAKAAAETVTNRVPLNRLPRTSRNQLPA